MFSSVFERTAGRIEPRLLEGWRGVFLRTDWLTPFVMIAISVVGVLCIRSATVNLAVAGRPNWEKQIVFMTVGWICYAVLAMLDYEKIRRHALKLWWAGVLLLLPVAICAILKKDLGTVIKSVNGARRWMDFGPLSIQPSELAKVSTVAMLAAVLADVRSWRWGDADIAVVSRAGEPWWLQPAGWALFVPVRLAGFLTLIGTPPVSAWCYLRHGKKWNRESKRIVFAALRYDPWRAAAKLATWPGTRVAAVALVPIGLIFVQPDLKSCIIYLPMLAALLYLARLPMRIVAVAALLAAVCGGLLAWDIHRYGDHLESFRNERAADMEAYEHANAGKPKLSFARAVHEIDAYEKHSPLFLLRDYQRERLMSFINPEVIDKKGGGSTWNVKQAIIAVGRGGLHGTGLNKGSQARLGYLPELAAHNDFIFSVFAEEFGFVGGALLIAGYAFIIGNTVRTAMRARDRFGALLCLGVASVLTVHVVVNIGMNIGVMPVSGLPLPFLSYGGSFVLSCFLLLGLVQSVHRYSRELPPRSGSGSDISTNALLDMRSPASAARL